MDGKAWRPLPGFLLLNASLESTVSLATSQSHQNLSVYGEGKGPTGIRDGTSLQLGLSGKPASQSWGPLGLPSSTKPHGGSPL